MSSKRSKKRARTDDGDGVASPAAAPSEEDQDIRLSQTLRGLMNGRKYVKQREITRTLCLAMLVQQGLITPVTLYKIKVDLFAGDSFSVDLEKGESSVKSLKSLIQDKEGISIFSQTLFKLAKSGKAEDASEFPSMADDAIIEESLSVALCISVLAQWDAKSPLITQS